MKRPSACLPKSPLNTRAFLRRALLRVPPAAASVALFFAGHSAKAANGADTWVGNTSTDWAGMNWMGTNNPPISGDSLVFGTDGTAGMANGDTLTNTLTSTAFNVAGITFNAGAPAYTMTGNTFTLTASIANNSGNLQTFSNTGISAPVTPTTTAGLTTASSTTWTPGTGGISLNALQFTETNTSGVTTTVNGAGNTLTIGTIGLDIGSGSRVIQTFTGSGNISVGTINLGGSGSNTANSFSYTGTGSMTITGVVQGGSNYSDSVTNGTLNLNGGTLQEGLNVSSTGNFSENASGVMAGGSSFAFAQTSSGTSNIAGTNTYTGGTSISAGTYNLTGVLGATAVSTSGTGVFTESNTGYLNTGATFTQGSTSTSTLSGSNKYTGYTTVNAGTLLLDFSQSATPASATNIISTGSSLVLGGGTLSIKGGGSSDTNSQGFFATALTAGTSSELSFAQNGDTTLSATLGALTRNAGSMLDVTLPSAGAVSTTSTTSATNTVLVSAATNGIAFATVNGGTAFATNTSGTIGVLTPTAGTYGSTANVSVTGGDMPASGAGANTLTFAGTNAATLTLSGTNVITTGGILITPSTTGATTITGGTIQGGTGRELVVINNEPNTAGSLTISSIIADSTSGSSALTIGSSLGAAGIAANPQRTVLSAANTFTGQTTLLSGTLDLSNVLALQNSALQLNAGTTLVFDQSANSTAFTLVGLSGGAANISLSNNASPTPAAIALTVGGNNASTTYTGVLSGSGSLTKVGTGSLTLGTASGLTYSGGLIVDSGIVGAANGSAPYGSGPVTLGLSGSSATAGLSTFSASNTITVEPGVAASGATGPGTALRTMVDDSGTGLIQSGAITLVGGGTFTGVQTNGTITLSGGIGGTGNFVNAGTAGATVTLSTVAVNPTGLIENNETGTGNLIISTTIGSNVLGLIQNGTSSTVLSGTNTFTGDTTITKGTLNVQSAAALQDSTVITNSTAGSLTFGPASATHLAAAAVGGLAGSGNINLNDQATGSAGAVALTIGNSNASLSGTNTITNTAVTNTLNPTYSGILSNTNGAASVTKVGSNTQTFTGANTYSGGTTVSVGTLLINNSLTTGSGVGSGAVLVSNGGTLGGQGLLTVTSATVNGTLAPGAMAGATTGALTLNTTSGLTINGTLLIGVNGTVNTMLTTTGGLTLSNTTSSLTIVGTLNGTSDYAVATSGIAITTMFFTNNVPSTYSVVYNDPNFDNGGGDIELEPIAAVPEPSTAWVCVMMLAGAGVYYRRQSRRIRA